MSVRLKSYIVKYPEKVFNHHYTKRKTSGQTFFQHVCPSPSSDDLAMLLWNPFSFDSSTTNYFSTMSHVCVHTNICASFWLFFF